MYFLLENDILFWKLKEIFELVEKRSIYYSGKIF